MSSQPVLDLREEDRYQEYIEMMEESHYYWTLDSLSEYIDKWGIDAVIQDLSKYYVGESRRGADRMASGSVSLPGYSRHKGDIGGS